MNKYRGLLIRLIPILVVIALTIGLSDAFYNEMIESEFEKNREELFMVRDDNAREISTTLTMNIKILDLAAAAIVTNVDSDLSNEELVLDYLDDVCRESLFDRVDLVYPSGRILVSTGDKSSPGMWVDDNGEKTYRALAEKGSHISERVPDHYTGKDALHVFAPIPVYDEEGLPIAILGATVYCSTLADVFKNVHYGEAAQPFLFDTRNGSIILDNHHEKLGNIYNACEYKLAKGFDDIDFVSSIMNGATGITAFISNETGENVYIAFTKVEGTELAFALVVGEEAVFPTVTELRHTFMWVGIIEISLLIVFGVWIYLVLYKYVQFESRAKEAELALLQEKDKELQRQYELANSRKEFMESLAKNLPGGYHRCQTDSSYRVTFMSNSFTDVTGYTLEQMNDELDGSYLGVVSPCDKELFLSYAPQLERDGFIHCAYRIRRRDGVIRWVQDSTQYIERDGETYYQCSLADITEQIEKVEQALKEAEASSQAKSTFLFNISHDIRTPMNAIKGFSHIIRENSHNPELVEKTVAKIEKAGDALILLMNDVLDISRIERGKEELTLQIVDLYEHGKNLYEMFAPEMRAAGITFTGDGDAIGDVVYADELKLTRIMMNMLSNAKKFTPSGGSVVFGATRLSSDEEHCTYRFFVRDTGIGMSHEFQTRAFEQFERERTSTESKISGSGLGLAIIKMFVELMDGSVELNSEPGKGTEIAAVITLRLADKEQAQAVTEQSLPDLSGKRILLVEDNEFNREIAKYILEGMHIEVDEAENGAICVEKLKAAGAGRYDLILMDLQMPVVDGYAATALIRELDDSEIASLPIIAMTANAFDEDRKKCLELGMNGHIGKPIDMDDLIRELTRVFKQ